MGAHRAAPDLLGLAERLAPMAPVDEVDLPDDLDAMLAQSGADDEDAPAAVMVTVEG